MRRTWATPRGILTHAVIDLSVAALLIVVSVVLLIVHNEGCIFTLILGIVALIGGMLALYFYSSASREAEADSGDAQGT